MKTAALVSGVFLLTVQSCAPATDHPDIVADLATETARMSVKISQEIAPAPKTDKCDNCNGTGIIGDGRVKIACPECKGTGKP